MKRHFYLSDNLADVEALAGGLVGQEEMHAGIANEPDHLLERRGPEFRIGRRGIQLRDQRVELRYGWFCRRLPALSGHRRFTNDPASAVDCRASSSSS